jgi:hypothetical protein
MAKSKRLLSKKFRLKFSKVGKTLTAITLGILIISCLITTARTITTVQLENNEGVPLGWLGLESTAISPRIIVNADEIVAGGFCDSILIKQSISNTDPHFNLLVTGMTSWLNRGVIYNPNGGFINFSDGASLEFSYNPASNDWQSIAVSPPGENENDSLFKSGSLNLAPAGQAGDTVHFRYRFQPQNCDDGLFNVLSAKTEIDGAVDEARVESRTTPIRPVRRGVYATNRRNIANNEYNRIGGVQFSTNSQGETRLGRGIMLRRGGGTGTWVITFDSSAQIGEYAIAYSASSAGAFIINLNVASEGNFTFGDGGGHNTSINHIKFGQVDDNGVVVVPDTLARTTIEEYFAPPEEAILDDVDFDEIIDDEIDETDDGLSVFGDVDDSDNSDIYDDFITTDDEILDHIIGSGEKIETEAVMESELENKYSRAFRVPNTGVFRTMNRAMHSRWWLITPLALFAICFTLWRLNENHIIRNNLRGNSKVKKKTALSHSPKSLKIASPKSKINFKRKKK